MAKAKTIKKSSGKKIQKARKKVAAKQAKAAGQPIRKVPGSTGKLLMATLTVGAAGVLGYFGWQLYKKKMASKAGNLDEELLKLHSGPTVKTGTTHSNNNADNTFSPPADTAKTKTGGSTTRSGSGDNFPLKKGSKGENVKQLQEALIEKYGKSILPKYGADGDFGSETLNALKAKGFPASITESIFNVITEGQSATGGNSAETLAQKLFDAADNRNITSVVNLLKGIKNKDEYQQVSNSFMQHRLNGVRQTLVNGLLSTFSPEEQKQKIRMEFIRMGLQYDGNKWSLAGFEGKSIVTTEAATVWVTATQSIQVPALMVLGNEVTQRLDFTLFENNNKYFLIKTQSVKYL